MDDNSKPIFPIVRLYDENKTFPDVIKVGILPFLPAKSPCDWQVLLMKPVGLKTAHAEPPTFQLAKGTRQCNVTEKWSDMREDDLTYADKKFHEKLLDTALREGHEEVGLKSTNIRTLYDLGGFTFISETKKKVKPLHMFAAEIRDPHDFDPFDSTTGETRWLKPGDFSALCRQDHMDIVNTMLERLRKKSMMRER